MSSANIPPASGNHAPQQSVTGGSGSWASYEPPSAGWPNTSVPYSRTTYRPTAEQLARDELRQRYLRRNVYIPIIIAALIAIALFVLIVVLAFGIRSPQAMSFIAGMSALVVIMFATPLIILMALMPISWLVITLNRRQKRKNFPETGPMAYRSRVQTLLWQLDGLLDGAQDGVDSLSVRARRPLVALHARAAYLRGWLNGIRGKFSRSI
jgi:hypothetical protein